MRIDNTAQFSFDGYLVTVTLIWSPSLSRYLKIEVEKGDFTQIQKWRYTPEELGTATKLYNEIVNQQRTHYLLQCFR